MARRNNKQLRTREEQEAVIALITFIQTAIGIFRLYLFILSATNYPRPSFAQNPEYYQTQVNAVNRFHPTHCHCIDQFMNSSHVSVSSTPSGSTPHTATPSSPTPTGSTPDSDTPSTFTPQPPPRRMQIPMTNNLQSNARAKKGRKRIRMGEEEDVCESLGHWCKESLGYMEKLANSLGYEKELAARRATISGELEKLDLTLIQQFKLAAIIGDKEERVDQFLNTRDEIKQAWAEAVLNGHVYGPIP